ncbi:MULTISPECIES: ribonuclease P protein component [Acidovorax]|jgi:ribonuclease P protein component|uniref:Ribonuclease P protein component n=1 Tax=Acidovorax facilis TaxID=12917 RepID=A0ABV8DA08_9BURK|nr:MULTISPECIES: ribonuclease P protein component [Acidovorax]OGA63991.1 MAG: ribonuclease P protein component [Burkholderiales bacterium RIFCSPHIGHO2_01_FULL_64_960]OGA80625.1 MAG: ribonuclease P protein component [Burkholderiales bacterium GWA2_64_37]OGB08144.1 MAG: ribonuclease P protein component [Burkholderiales bacterium RIFCSPHIGHO2_02_FULL_64_19]OGB19103.1 MAG: ribonuclease P protein component [Burkholderiales bacterium RIFCSPHIGHO2_12_FULL_65_48]OGB59605.1 MAG: ribonuclease P protein 
MHRLKTRPQFQATMAGGTVSRTAHFVLHRLVLDAEGAAADRQASAALPTGPGSLPQQQGPQALFAVQGVWLGAMVPKRWARRAVTRNTIKRQIYTVGATFEARLPQAAHVVRLRTAFDRKQFVSATSDQLKQAVRAELLQLFGYAARRAGGAGAASPAQQQGGVAEPVVPC